SLDDLSPSAVCPYRNVQIILSEAGSWPLSSMLASHSPRTIAHDAQEMRERPGMNGLGSHVVWLVSLVSSVLHDYSAGGSTRRCADRRNSAMQKSFPEAASTGVY